MLTQVIGEAAREVMAGRTRREADAVTDAAIAVIERLGVLPEVADEVGDVPADGPIPPAPR